MGAPGEYFSQNVNILLFDQPGLEGFYQFDLLVRIYAVPVVNHDIGRANKSFVVYLAPGGGWIRIYDRYDHLAVVEPFAPQHRRSSISCAAYNIRSLHHRTRIRYRNNLCIQVLHIIDPVAHMVGVRAKKLYLFDLTNGAYGLRMGPGLPAGS